MTEQISFRKPHDFAKPILVEERDLIRMHMRRYLRKHGATRYDPLSYEKMALVLTEYAPEYAPSKTAIEGFVDQSMRTDVKFVRLFKHFLVDTGFCRREELEPNKDLEANILNYATILRKTEKKYADKFGLFVDLCPENKAETRFVLHWKFEYGVSGLFQIMESELHIYGLGRRTGRTGYALSTEDGQFVGILSDDRFLRVTRFTLVPKPADDDGNADIFHYGVMTLLSDGGRILLDRRGFATLMNHKAD